MDSDNFPTLEFPCVFPLKVIGRHAPDDDFKSFALAIIRRHVPKLHEDDISFRLSSSGNYLSVSVTFIAESRDQVDRLYRELSSFSRVMMIL
jgi:putative lipoic acid-binding regulatory protein